MITLDKATLTAGVRTISVYFEKYEVKMAVTLITKVITTADELLNFTTYANVTNRDSDVLFTYDGYFVLGNNIDMTDKFICTKIYTGESKYGFTGTFDGRGYCIINGTYGHCGLFGQIAPTGVVKNVAIVNATMQNYDYRPGYEPNWENYNAEVLAWCHFGTVENVLIEVTGRV